MSTIITVATMKGGSGKSTLASCLAVHWQLAGRRPTLIDADPQRSIARLAARERALGAGEKNRERPLDLSVRPPLFFEDGAEGFERIYVRLSRPKTPYALVNLGGAHATGLCSVSKWWR